MTLTVEQILAGTRCGRMQSVGQMQVIPLLGEDDDTFSPPEFEVGTSDYGTVNLRNDSDRPTIAPPGAGWVVKEAAQDHAIGGGALIPAGKTCRIDTAMCIQQSQGGYISKAKHAMLILPAALRSRALSMRKDRGYDKLWDSIGKFNDRYGCGSYGGHLEYFLKQYAKELDEFVAEFELVEDQVGAIVLISGGIVGIERAPSTAFWEVLWEPLIRVCYGSLAIHARDKGPPATRVPLMVTTKTLDGIRAALTVARQEEEQFVQQAVGAVSSNQLSSGQADQVMGKVHLTTVASRQFAGQVVSGASLEPIHYASLCAAGA